MYDVIFDAVGKQSFRRCRGSLEKGGTFLETDLGFMWHVTTGKAIELGLARTGKLATSAALILMGAFLVLSTSPGYEIKSLAIGLAAGIIVGATVIRALLVPALMKLLGDANWWMPGWIETVLRIPHPEPTPELPVEPPRSAPALG